MELRETERGIEVAASSYRLLLERRGGFACREVELRGTGRLDRFDRAGEGPHPTCMYFDNLTLNNAFQLAHYGRVNDSVAARVRGASVELSGLLIPVVDGARGRVAVRKTMRFEEDLYEASVALSFEGVGPIDYASVWWDVHDKWLRAMRSSAGVFMPLAVGTGESYGDTLARSWRPMTAMDRGAGVWMEMLGESGSVLAGLASPAPASLPAGGMKFWDGPDDADEGEGVSHGCINLDVVNSELSGVPPLPVRELSFAYRVFLSGPTVLRAPVR
jgi:hypothetical protein